MNDQESPKLCCLLTPPELQQRKLKVLNLLQSKIRGWKEFEDGYEFKFEGADGMLDSLCEFIKTERACCPFFTFGLTVQGPNNDLWLRLSGPSGVKDFIRDELGFLSS